jgi:hypothetical protein
MTYSIIMQNSTDQAAASTPTEITVVSDDNGPNWNRTVNVRRKAAKRTRPFELTEEELELVSPPQDEDILARKRPRLEEPLLTASDEANRETDSPDVSLGHSPPTVDSDDANSAPVVYDS